MIERDRSRTPPRPTTVTNSLDDAQAALAAAAPQFIAQVLQQQQEQSSAQELLETVQGCQVAGAIEEAERGLEAVSTDAPDAPPDEVLEPNFRCFGCREGFANVEELRKHLVGSHHCCDNAWQFAVRTMACLPGAGTELWCPACPAQLDGRWTGPATRAAAFLRHAAGVAAGVRVCGDQSSEANAARHTRLWASVVELLLADPAPVPATVGSGAQEATAEVDTERLSGWAASARALELAGPLLAKPCAAARKTIWELQDELVGPASAARGEDEEDTEATKAAEKRRVWEESQGPGYDLYGEDIPLDVVTQCVDAQPRTAEGVPILEIEDSEEDDDMMALLEHEVANVHQPRRRVPPAPAPVVRSAPPPQAVPAQSRQHSPAPAVPDTAAATSASQVGSTFL